MKAEALAALDRCEAPNNPAASQSYQYDMLRPAALGWALTQGASYAIAFAVRAIVPLCGIGVLAFAVTGCAILGCATVLDRRPTQSRAGVTAAQAAACHYACAFAHSATSRCVANQTPGRDLACLISSSMIQMRER